MAFREPETAGLRVQVTLLRSAKPLFSVPAFVAQTRSRFELGQPPPSSDFSSTALPERDSGRATKIDPCLQELLSLLICVFTGVHEFRTQIGMFLSSASSVLDFVNSSIAAVGSRKGRQQQGCSVRVRTGVCFSPHYVCFKLALSGPHFLSCLHCRIFEPRRCLD